MDNFKKAYLEILHINKPIYKEYLLNQPICEYKSIKIKNNHLIFEMNNNVFPIPKDLLSFYVKEVYENGFYYVYENIMSNIINLTKSSDNFDILKIKMNKLELTKNKHFLFICLPYKENLWIEELKKYFNEEEIKSIFKDFNNERGCYGTYHSGFLIIINANFLKCLKDIEEVTEHEFVHMFEDINGEENDENLSFDIVSLLGHPSEFKTYTINLMNRLDKIYNKYLIKNKIKDDNKKERKNFLDKMFDLVKNSPSPEYLTMQIEQYYDDSKLVGDDMMFFWNMLHWKTKEYEKFKNDIYDHFLK